MVWIGGARVDHRPAGFIEVQGRGTARTCAAQAVSPILVRWADEVGVGARPGHHAAVVGRDADHARGKAHGAARQQLTPGVTKARGVEVQQLGVGRFVRGDRAFALQRAAHAGHGQRDTAGFTGPGQQAGHMRVPPHQGEVAPGGGHELETSIGLQGIGRSQPAVGGGFAAIGRGLLTRGCDGQEESGVEALDPPRRRQPMAEVVPVHPAPASGRGPHRRLAGCPRRVAGGRASRPGHRRPAGDHRPTAGQTPRSTRAPPPGGSRCPVRAGSGRHWPVCRPVPVRGPRHRGRWGR